MKTKEEYKQKAEQIISLIWSQPPEVIEYLADFFGEDDGDFLGSDSIAEVVDNIAYETGRDGKEIKNEKIKSGMNLPDILVDINIAEDGKAAWGRDTVTWEFSKKDTEND